MKKYIIDFDAWTTVEADNQEHAMQIAQAIIYACQQEFQDTHIILDMVVRDGGIQED